MKKIKIFDDTYAFHFDELDHFDTFVYLIEREDTIFLIDTFCGDGYMQEIKKHMNSDKEWIIINTHYHFDHIWGNESFPQHTIIGHEKIISLIEDTWEHAIEKFGNYYLGNKQKVLPNIVFQDRYEFKKEQITLLYTPGHSIDSISIYDKKNKAMYTGDNLEKPIIQLALADKQVYIETIKEYLSYSDVRYFAGHTLELTKTDINEILSYLNNPKQYSFEDFRIQEIHQFNLKMIGSK